MNWLGLSLSIATPEQKQIPRKNKSKETPAVLIIRKERIQESVKTGKIYKGYSLMHPENESLHKISRPFQHKIYYEGDTDDNNLDDDDSW